MSTVYKYFNVPDDSDTPDVPRDMRRLVDGQWRVPGAVQAQVNGPSNISYGDGRTSLVSVSHTFALGSLLHVSASTQFAHYGVVAGTLDIRSDGKVVSPQFNINGSPTGTFPISAFYISAGPARVELDLYMTDGSVDARYRLLSIRALSRG